MMICFIGELSAEIPVELKSTSEKLVVDYKQTQLKKNMQDLSDRY